jgi:hypothetical protein
MKNIDKEILVYAFIAILIIFLIAFVYQNYNIEKFDVASYVSPSDFDPNVSVIDFSQFDPTYFDPDTYEDPLANTNEDIPSRACSIYYVSDPNLAKDAELRKLCDKGFFNKPKVAIQVRQKFLENRKNSGINLTKNETYELKAIYNYYNKLKDNLPNGSCKLDFPGWSEPISTPDGENYPIKNGILNENSSRGNPLDWAYCFQEVSSGSTGVNENVSAENASKKFADNISVISTNHAVNPFNDGKSYARVAFKTLALDDFVKSTQERRVRQPGAVLNNFICASGNLPQVSGLPADGSFLAFQLDSSNKIVNFSPVIYNSTSQRMNLVSEDAMMDVVKAFVTLQQRGNGLYLVPNRFNSTIYTLDNDLCVDSLQMNTILKKSGRIKSVIKTKQLMFSLVANLGLSPILLYESLGADDLSYGDVNTLNARLAEVQTQSNLKKTEIDNFPQPPAVPDTPGIRRNRYKVNKFEWGTDTIDMNNIFIDNTRTTFEKSEIVAIPKYYGEQHLVYDGMQNIGWQWIHGRGWKWGGSVIRWRWEDIHFAFVYEGFIKAPETGEYTILINSDDGGDVSINGNVVASYYGGHWVSFGGTDGKITLEAGKYYPIKIRMVEWAGAVGVQVYWLRPSRTNLNPSTCPEQTKIRWYLPNLPANKACFEEIPESAYFYYSDPTGPRRRAQYNQMIADRQQLEQNIAIIQNAIATISGKITTTYREFLDKIRNATFTGIDYATISNDGVFYIYIGPFTNMRAVSQALEIDMIKLIESSTNICGSRTVMNSPLNANSIQSGIVQYAISFWIRVDDLDGRWRNVIFHGESDDWTQHHKIDRTPGIWVIPNSTALHVSHCSSRNANPWINIDYKPAVNTWYHVVTAVDNNNTKIYVNGTLKQNVTLPNNDEKFIWNQQNKKFYINNSPPWGGKCSTSIMIQKLYWHNKIPTQPEITTLASSLPFPKTIPDLLAQATNTGLYTLLVNNTPVNLFVFVDTNNKKWVLILRYSHLARTNPALKVIKNGNFPIPPNNTLIGDSWKDESIIDGAWGHIAPSYLAQFSVSEVAFWATGGSQYKTINFSTNDRSVINYITSGQGNMPPNMQHTKNAISLGGHNASIPGNAPHYYGNQGDYALTSFPFWRSGQAHWGIGAGVRWEVDDFSGNQNYNTLHMVFIR